MPREEVEDQVMVLRRKRYGMPREEVVAHHVLHVMPREEEDRHVLRRVGEEAHHLMPREAGHARDCLKAEMQQQKLEIEKQLG